MRREEAPPQFKESFELPKIEWKTFSDKGLNFSFSYMAQFPNQPIEVREASWGRYIDQEIPSLSKPTGVSYTIKVYPASSMTEYYGQKVAGDKVWADAVNHIKGFAPGSVADPTLMAAATFPVPIGQGKVVSSRSGELGVETWFVDVPSGTLVHKVAFMVDPEIVYEFRTNYTLLGTSIKWKELKDSIINGTADGQYLLGYENFMLAVATFHAIGEESLVGGWRKYKNAEYGFEISYPENWEIELPGADMPTGNGQFSFWLKPKSPSVDRLIALTVNVLEGKTAKYVFGVCCKNSEKVLLGGKTFDKVGPYALEGALEINHYYGDGSQLAKFSLGIGMRDDPPPLPKIEDVQKEISDVDQILSTFIFLE